MKLSGPRERQLQRLVGFGLLRELFSALGTALGGFISEHYSPRYCLALTTICVGIGYLVMRGGSGLLREADRVPTEVEDTEAMQANLDTNK